MNLIQKQILKSKLITNELRLQKFFIILIFLGIPLNLYKNSSYDDSWTIGEWLISYAGGFVRRGLPGELIHIISERLGISPIFLVWLVCIFSLISLAIIILYFGNKYFETSFLLSQVVILAPISEDFFIRKDIFLVFLFGLSLFTVQKTFEGFLNKYKCIIIINILSIIAILSHESFGIWGLPSINLILYIYERSQGKNLLNSFLFPIYSLLPTTITFLLCWQFKGNSEQALIIHQSWQNLSDIISSKDLLNAPRPEGAIAAIGWGTSQVFTSTLFRKFNLNIFWHPGMWLMTIYLVMKLFIGYKKDKYQEAKRAVLCFQLIAFMPMFMFVDIGRWIFMWVSSSVLLFGFFVKLFGINNLRDISLSLKGSNLLPKIIPSIRSYSNYKIILLMIGIPHCCWSMGRYLISNPIGFSIKNLIFYAKLLFF